MERKKELILLCTTVVVLIALIGLCSALDWGEGIHLDLNFTNVTSNDTQVNQTIPSNSTVPQNQTNIPANNVTNTTVPQTPPTPPVVNPAQTPVSSGGGGATVNAKKTTNTTGSQNNQSIVLSAGNSTSIDLSDENANANSGITGNAIDDGSGGGLVIWVIGVLALLVVCYRKKKISGLQLS